MDRRIIALVLFLGLAVPLIGHAEPASPVEQPPAAELGLTAEGNDDDASENTRMENLAISAATGAAIGSVWLGPGTAIGLVVGGIYGFFFK